MAEWDEVNYGHTVESCDLINGCNPECRMLTFAYTVTNEESFMQAAIRLPKLKTSCRDGNFQTSIS